MFTLKQIEKLKEFKPEDDTFVVSVYLNTDGQRYSKKEVEVMFKDMVKVWRAGSDEEKFKAVEDDIRKIEIYLSQNLDIVKSKGVALFSCVKKDLWQVYNFMVSPANEFVVDNVPYLRPLLVITSKYHRICTVVFDHRKARIFEIFMGDINLKAEIYNETPKKVKVGGYKGYEQTRIAEHKAKKIAEHYKRIADKIFEVYQKDKFDWLVVGGRSEDINQFVKELHPYLKKIHKGSLNIPIDATEADVLRRTLAFEAEVESEDEKEVVEKLLTHSHSETSRMAVVGIKDVMRAINEANVDKVVFTLDFNYAGKYCPNCSFLALKEDRCPVCGAHLVRLNNIVMKLIEIAISKGARIYPVFTPGLLNREGIGAFLRHKGITKTQI